jgi:dCTP deaminase
VAVVESAIGSEFRAFGGIGGGVHVLVYDAVDAEAIVISRAGQLKTASSISNLGILMTNPGHIDPGFKGILSFTLINMGREPYLIKKGDKLVTLLLVQLGLASSKDYGIRSQSAIVDKPIPHDLFQLGRDFLDIDNRSREVARRVSQQENSSMKWWQVVIALIIAALTTGGSIWGSTYTNSAKINNLENKIEQISQKFDLQERFGKIDKEIDILKTRIPAK